MSDTQEIAPAMGLHDLASFLTDTPETEPENEENEAQPSDESTLDEDTDDTENDQPEESEDDEAKADDESEEEPDETPKPDRALHDVTVKDAEGKDIALKVSIDELKLGYMRQQDHTRKAQSREAELNQRESQAVEFLKGKHEEIRNSYLQRAETIEAAFSQLVGMKSDEEMAQLANTDPASWVQENQRRQSILGFVSNLRQQTQAERERASQERAQGQQQNVKAMYEKAWTELQKDKIDKPALKKIYDGAAAGYGFSEQELANVYDPRLVRVMRDAQAFRELKAKAPAVQKQAAAAPRLPSKQAQNLNTRKDQALEGRFKSGRAKLSDLAQFLS